MSSEQTLEEIAQPPSPDLVPVSDAVEDEEPLTEQPQEEALEDPQEEAEEVEDDAYEISEEHTCQLCNEKLKEPRVLSCLHVFCTECLKKQLEPATPEGESSGCEKEIVCNVCGQDTKIGAKGVEELPLDHVMVNILDMEAILKMQIICTSCKAKEKAVARCSDCANFLCPNCVTAHQYMRCFENHKVVSFEEMQNDEDFALHKPLFCTNHSTENLKYFCVTCQMPICTECMVTEHRQPGHESVRLADKDDSFLEILHKLVGEAKGKVQLCEDASSTLENALTELQEHRDNAKGLVIETFQSYKAFIEKQKDDLLAELESIHSRKEDHIMSVFDNVGKMIERIDDSCKFTERTLERGNAVEILLMKRIIGAQLLSLINNSPKPEVNVNIDFETDPVKFEENIKKFFGWFKQMKEDLSEDTPGTSLHSSFENEGISLPSGLLSPTPPTDILPPVSGSDFMPSLPPLSLANIHTNLPPATALSGVSPQTINSIASSIQNLSSVPPPPAPTTIERSSSRNSYSPAMSDSGISVDAASNGSGANQAVVNVAALAKLGTVSVNQQGQITLNGQIIPGLTVNNVSGLSQVLANRAPTPTTPMTPITPDPDKIKAGKAMQALVNLLGMNPSSGVIPRSVTPQMGDISNLLTQPPSVITQTGISGAPASGLSPPAPGSAFTLHSHPPFPPRNSAKVSHMQIRCKFGQLGPGKSQFNSPHGFCLGIDEDIVVADTNNHRIQVFEKTGEFKYQFGIPGREEGQMWYPRKVAVIRHSGKYVVCDRGNERSRMQIFTKNGHFLKKIAIRYIDIVAGLAISHAGHIVAVDSVSPTVFVISDSSELIKWFDCSDYMREPSDIAVNGKEYFVCDFKGHCVVVFNEDGQFMRRIGCENITNFPNGIDISDAGDVLVGDSHGNRFHVAVFQRDGSLIGEFECPYVKVSRCCGLKITSEGYVVTLAKNNHHVLVLNTLYIT